MTAFIAFVENNWISIIAAFIGLVYLYLEYKARVWMWAASIVMAAFYIYIFYTTKLYASMAIYIYFFFASVYGWVMWITHNRNKETGEEVITHVERRYFLPIVLGVTIIWGIIHYVLLQFSDNSMMITIGDSLATSLNIVALWMAAHKWAEQWLLLIPANFISGFLLFVQQDVMSGCLFMVFFIVSVFGYFKWRNMISYP